MNLFARSLLPYLLLAAFMLPSPGVRAETFNPSAMATAASFRTSEYNWSWGLAAVKAADAYSRNWTGAGQIVAVFDTGITASNREFSGRIAGQYDVYTQREMTLTDRAGHGTFVSGIIAAQRDGYGMHGLAYASRVLAINLADSSSNLSFTNNQLAAGIRYALAKNARIFNNSWNSSVFVTQYTKAQLEYGLGTMLTAYREAVRANALIVFAAGNDGKAHPGLYAALPYYFTELKNGWIAAVATDPNGAIASYSNRCGHAAAWCMAAPGSGLISTQGTGYARGSGTSFAAPMISAAAAIIKQRWPALTNAQIKEILFKTANKSGIYANTAIYGQGFLDLEKATGPLGTVSAATGTTTAGKTALTTTAINLGSLSPGVRVADGLQTIVLDDYDRDFAIEAQSLFESPAPHFDSAAALAGFGNGMSLFSDGGMTMGFAETIDARTLLPGAQLNGAQFFYELNGDSYGFTNAYNISPAAFFSAAPRDILFNARLVAPDAVGNAYLGFVKNPVTLAVTANLGRGFYAKTGGFFGDVEDDPAASLTTSDDPNLANRTKGVWGSLGELGYRVAPHSTLTFTGGAVVENGTVLGAGSAGATALASRATTGFVGVGASFDLGKGLTAFAGYDMGWTTADAASHSLVTDVGTLASSAFRAGLLKTGVRHAADQIGFIVAQPLRVDSGSVGLTLPTARDIDGNLTLMNTRADLSSSARALDWQAFYQTPVDSGSSIATGVLLRQNEGQRAGDSEAVLLSRYRLAF